MTPTLATIENRSIPEPNSGCLIWLGCIDRHGHARARVNGKPYQHVARVAYECVHGKIPAGLVIDHLCRVRCCVNPNHLEPVTPRENVMRGNAPQITRARHAAKTHCPHGHEYSPQNTYWYKKNRFCRECGRIAVKAYHDKLRRM
jgi:hypothetical protein